VKTTEEIINIAQRTIKDEATAIANLENLITDDFSRCVELILSSTGKVVLTGIGKSANIAAKIVATLSSTGTPATFMHAADAIHGDLGSIQKEDVIICLSKSGNTPEIKVLVPLLKMMGNKLIALVGNKDSYLAQQCDFVLDATVDREACPNNLAPTSSTTAQLVIGDALAVCLLECRGFTAGDFAKLHPGGTLGKQLYLTANDLYPLNQSPKVQVAENIRNVLIEISSKRLGCAAVLQDEKLVGIITDGDLRRMLQKDIPVDQLTARDIMSANPRTIPPDVLLVDALHTMRSNNITQLLVVDKDKYLGVIHLHDILKEGIL
jgi:arabinose-5-phosphate isomerase